MKRLLAILAGLFVGLGVGPGGGAGAFAQGMDSAPCDPEELLAEARALIQAGKRATFVARVLEQAVQCRDGDLVYEIDLLEAVTLLRLGEMPAARRYARQAQKVAGDDRERERASQLVNLLQREIQEVTFVPPEGQGRVAVRIEKVDPGSLPEGAVWTSILGELAGYGQGAFPEMVEAARRVTDGGARDPLRVWLVRGVYTLSSGQRLVVRPPSEGGGESLTYVVQRVDWIGRQTMLGVGLLEVIPLNSERISLGQNGAVGLVLYHGRPLEHQLMLSGELGYYPVVIPASRGCPDVSEGTYSAEVLPCSAVSSLQGSVIAHNLSLGIGVSRQFSILRGVPVQVGLDLRVLELLRGVSLKFDWDEGYWVGAVYAWTGLVAAPQVRFFYHVQAGGAFSGDLFLGLTVGAGTALFYKLPDDAPTDSHPRPWVLSTGSQVGAMFHF